MSQLFRIDGGDSHPKNRKYKFYLDGIKLSQFEDKLQKWPNWIQFKREIKLNSLLEGKKFNLILSILMNGEKLAVIGHQIQCYLI